MPLKGHLKFCIGKDKKQTRMDVPHKGDVV